ncbi:UvrB/UvrC motif-containing protein [Caryophanon latum]|uniref:Nucleotide excision repair protein n=1 Tax=Caryophanon latum TaxID=33977 RepID=A0A1C0YXI7_9BACL|nr:UvrB/UvrC motif-containing protein [Caryophanon latum]OCS91877.1 nucleotide excision repair protein [Caryophanon latum]
MICENCQQREAAIVVTQVNNGHQLKKHLCHECAANIHPFHVEQQHDTLHDMLSTWFGTPTWQKEKQPTKKQTVCASCHTTFEQFLQDGKFGCSDCYDAFRDHLPQLLKRLHGGTEHIGKMPNAVSEKAALKKRIELLRQTMRTAVEEERFEDAAKLRDEARALEAQLAGGETS